MGDDPTQATALAVIDGGLRLISGMDVAITGALHRSTPPLPPFVLAQWRAVAAELHGFVSDLRAEVVATGDTWTIRGAADQWATMAGILKAAAAEIDADQLAADDGFAGAAASAYRDAAPAQRDAYAWAFKDVADRVAGELDELADLTGEYLAAAATCAFELALACVTLGRSLTGVSFAQQLAQVAGFAAGARSSIETWLTVLLEFSDHSGDIAMRWLELRQDTSLSVLPGGSWPKAVVPGFDRTSGP
ncbi:hypothetical protein [Nocardioides hwasunensis]|uniref:WXG100 family type VII secretion target n=1 Tax=Nocardioides hwasunensis TaxID=397258 RepID=A0ABR8MM65_9ACTN|nr:hypothetical protein [Nocardioides hwasunensis]MBD3916336.1 hypothetical protein [Nocardioides hwasunensis]